MRGHAEIRLTLYEYVRGELGDQEAQLVEEHIARCPECAREAASLRSVLKVVPDPSNRPSAALPDAYWKGFANEVMARIGPGPVRAPGLVERLAARLPGLRSLTPDAWIPGAGASGVSGTRIVRISAGLAAAVVAGVALYFALPGGTDAPGDAGKDTIADGIGTQTPGGGAGETGERAASRAVEDFADGSADGSAERVAERSAGRTGERSVADAAGFSPDSLTPFDRRLYDYFRRSKALLVGMSNLDPAGEEAADLWTERSISRSLLSEARYLKTGPVDVRSYKLMDDLDRILIGLANTDARTAAPTVEIIRDVIEARNLLFKLRMQETRSFPVPVRQASYRQ